MNFLLLVLFAFQDPTSDVQENLKVTYRQVQIRVQDGNLVPKKGLRREDFIIKVNDKSFDPESFLEVDTYPGETLDNSSTTPATEAPAAQNQTSPNPEPASLVQEQSAVAIFLDPGLSTINGFQTMKKTANELVDQLPPHTKVAIYQMHYSLKNLVLLSDDRDLIKKGIEDAVYFADLWNNLEALQTGINSGVRDALEQPKSRSIDQNASASTGKLVASSLALVPLIHLGELLKFKKQVKDSYTNKVAQSLSFIGTALGNFPGERSIYMLTAGGYVDDTNRSIIRTATAKLNWENIPIHTIHFRDRDTKALNLLEMSRQSESEINEFNQALKLGGYVQNPSAVNALVDDDSFLKSSPKILAEETGGTFVSAFNALQVPEQLKRTRLAAGHYYLISYPSSTKLDKIDITLKSSDEKLYLTFGNTRGSYAAPIGKNQKSKNIDFATALVYGMVHDDAPISWEFKYFVNPEGTHVFPVLGKVRGDFPKGGYKLAMVALSATGEILDERNTEIRKPGDTGQLQFYDLLVCEVRPARIRAMIQETESGESALSEMILPEKAEGPNLSAIVLVPAKPSETFAIHSLNKEQVKLGKKKVARDKFDPLLLSPQKRIPLAFGPFTKGEPIGLYFHAENLDGKIDSYDLESYLAVAEKKQNAPIKINKVDDIGTNQASLMAVLDTSPLSPGSYLLGLRLKDKRTGVSCAYSEQEIQIQ